MLMPTCMAMENMSQNLVIFFFLIGNPTLNCVNMVLNIDTK